MCTLCRIKKQLKLKFTHLSIEGFCLPLSCKKQKILKTFKHILFLLIVIGLFSSCLKNEICNPATVELNAGIYSYRTENDETVLASSTITIDSIYAIGLDKNILLNTTTGAFSLPFDNASDKSSYVIAKGNTKDTIQIEYDKQLVFYSVKCGTYYTYTVTRIEYTHHLIQEIILNQAEVNAVATENIQVVY